MHPPIIFRWALTIDLPDLARTLHGFGHTPHLTGEPGETSAIRHRSHLTIMIEPPNRSG